MANIKSKIIFQELLERITEGDLVGKMNLPSENALANFYNCSRPTIRKAIAALHERGLVFSVKGSGAYITGRLPKDENPRQETFVGIIFPNVGPDYFYDLLSRNLAKYASEASYSLVLGGYISPNSEKLKLDMLLTCERYIAQKIQGVFFAPFGFHPMADTINREIVSIFSAANIPIILLDANILAHPAPNEYNLVSLDHFHSGYCMAEYMISLGLKRLFFLAQPNSHHSIKLRFMGFRAAILNHYGPYREEPDTVVELWQELTRDDREGLQRFIEKARPDGIVCSNDMTAVSVMRSLETLGINVPEDISLAGFDGLSRELSYSRSITSIEQPVDAMSRTAVTIMMNLIRHPQMPAGQVTFQGKLVVGDSTRKIGITPPQYE
ncbi:MAG: substrate-binding domain-containing protein [Treponema sp.]|jgi:DNA-binding LacI/PurR family transcriptional regulator|nr:substrate-binding domain-containing protein [Treponema sp.]